MRLILNALLIAITSLPGIVLAEGFRIDDLRELDVDASGYVGGETFLSGSKEPVQLARYDLGTRADGATVLFLRGDPLVIRSVGPDLVTADANGRRALETICRKIVEGKKS